VGIKLGHVNRLVHGRREPNTCLVYRKREAGYLISKIKIMNENKLETSLIVPVTPEFIERRIHLIRGQKVMLDSDLAELYQVETKVLNQAVQRNRCRFPSDFMFKLALNEATCLRSQIVTSKIGRGGHRYEPYAFTELGVAMLSSVLRSDRAVQMNIFIMRAFVKLRQFVAGNKELSSRVDQLEIDQLKQGKVLVEVYTKVKEFIDAPAPAPAPIAPKHKMGFSTN